MKKLLCMLLLAGVWITSSSFGDKPETLTKEDRKTLTRYMKQSKATLIGKIKDLTPEQWSYKPAPEVWSVAEICEHIYKAEPGVLKKATEIDQQEYKPDQMVDYKTRGDEIKAFVIGRTEKFQAPKPIRPEGAFESPQAFIEDFIIRRDATIDFVKTTDKPLKAYYEVFGPVGEVNGYDWLMIIAAHTERHTRQLMEVLEDPGFPL